MAEFSRQGGNLTINQLTDRAIINWQDFSIAQGELTRFLQPDSSSAVLNRVVSGTPSQIFGSLLGNGKVYLINRNGILVGNSGVIDTQSFIASTLDVGDDDFMAGGDLEFIGNSLAAITNQGRIRGLGGDVFLIAPQIDNQGEIRADGAAGLAAGAQVMLRESGSQRLWVGAAPAQLAGNATGIDNSGLVQAAQAELQAAGGNVYALSINNSGAVRANTVSNEGGRILLRAGSGGTVINRGTLAASSDSGKGGRIEVTGENVGLMGNAVVDASGETGGGEILIGGDLHGANEAVANAKRTYVGKDVKIDADAGARGDGGKVVVWADDTTRYAGEISARGGSEAGDGGVVEVSGKENLVFGGHVDAGAANGEAGSLLLDPRNITVAATGATTADVADVDAFADAASTDHTIAPDTITAITNTGTAVNLQANNDIFINSNITSNNASGNGGALSFRAGRSIAVNAVITSDNGNMTFVANDAGADHTNRDTGTASFQNDGQIHAGTGTVSITVDAGNAAAAADKRATGDLKAGTVTASALTVNHAGYTAGGTVDLGATTLTGNLNVTSNDRNVTNDSGAVTVLGTADFTAGAGDVTITGANTDFDYVRFGSANNVTLNDTNAMRVGSGATSNIAGNLNVTTKGPIGSGGAVAVQGTTTLTANSGGFGTSSADITMTHANDFVGALTATAAGSINIVDSNALTVDDVTAGSSVTLNSGGSIAFDNLTSGNAVSMTSNGNITASGRLFMPTSTVLTMNAGTANDITLTDPTNQFQYLAINAARDVDLVSNGAVQFWGNSSVSRDLDLTAGGTIRNQATNSGSVSVGGAATFRVTAADSDLLLGGSGNGNNFAGTVTMTTSGAGSYRDLAFRNTNSGASIIGGFPGTLRSASFVFDNAASVTLPSMIITGGNVLDVGYGGHALYVRAPNGDITQSGPLVVNTAGAHSRFLTGWGKNVTLTDAGNDFQNFIVDQANDVSVRDSNGINIWHIFTNSATGNGDLSVVANGNIGLSSYFRTKGVASFDAGAANNITLNNYENMVGGLRFVSANNVSYYGRNNILLGETSLAGTLGLHGHTGLNNLTLSQSGPVTTGGTTTFNNFSGGITLNNADNSFGALAVTGMTTNPTISIRENDAITQSGAWNLAAGTLNLTTSNNQAITLDQANQYRYVNVNQVDGGGTAGAVSVRNTHTSYGIAQTSAWTTNGTTTLNAGTNGISLTNVNNALGDVVVAAATDINLVEDHDITQGAAWSMSGKDVVLTARNGKNIVLDRAGNLFGDLTLSGNDVTVVENGAITQDGAWTATGTASLNAGANNITLENVANDFNAVDVNAASNASIIDANALVIAGADVTSKLTLRTGGELTQTGAISATDLRLYGTGGFATLTNAGNDVSNLAATFTGGDLAYTDADDFTLTTIDDSTGVSIGAHDVTLTSLAGTVNGLANIHQNTTSLDVTAQTLSLPAMTIAGAQSYTAAGGITLNSNLNSTAAGDIRLTGPMTLANNINVQSLNSDVLFDGTVTGATRRLSVDAGSGATTFTGAVSDLGTTIGSTALTLMGSGTTTFESTVGANNGITAGGPVVFRDSVTLADGNAGSNFSGRVTLGKAGGMNFSGYDNLTFGGGLLLANGPATIDSNSTTLTLGDAVSGPYALTMNAGDASIVGLSNLQADLTGLSLTAYSLILPNGLSIDGPQTFTLTDAEGSIRLGGALTSTAAGDISFNSPVTLTAASTVTSTDSAINFAGAVNGAHNLTLNSGTGLKTFTGAVGNITPVGSGTGAALTLQGSGATTFGSTVTTASGITSEGDVTFDGNVTLGNGDTGSTFTGAVTAGNLAITGHDGLAFDGGVNLVDGPLSVTSNGSTIGFGNTVSGAQQLTLNALANGAGTVTGLQHIDSNLTGLDVTAQTLSLPGAGLAVSGAMDFTAAGGITLNGAVGNAAYTGAIDFNGPVTLATQDITVASNDANITFANTVSGAQNLTVNAGSGAKQFSAAVSAGTGTGAALTLQGSGANTFGNTVNLASGMQVQNGGNVTFNNDVTLADGDTASDFGSGTLTIGRSGATTTLSGHDGLSFGGAVVLTNGAVTLDSNNADMTFDGTVKGNQNLTVNAGALGNIAFNGAVGGSTAGEAIGSDSGYALQVTNANGVSFGSSLNTRGGVDVNAPAEFRGDVTLAGTDAHHTFYGPVTFNQAGGITVTSNGTTHFADAVNLANGAVNLDISNSQLTIDGAVNGAQALDIDSNDSVTINGAIGATDALGSISIDALHLSLGDATTAGSQQYTANLGATLAGNLTSGNANIDVTGPVNLANGVTLDSGAGAGNIRFNGTTSTINGNHDLVISAGTGNVVLGGVVGGATPLASVDVSGNDVTLPQISTSVASAQTYNALNNLTLTQSRTINGPAQFRADADDSGAGSFILLDGVSVTAVNNDLSITAADIDMQGASTLNSGAGRIILDGTAGRSIVVGDDVDATGAFHVSASELSRMFSAGGLDLTTTGNGDIAVGTISNANSSNLTGRLRLRTDSVGTGDVNFAGPSVFHGYDVGAGGTVIIGNNLTTRGGDIDVTTPAQVIGAAVLNSQGGDIAFSDTLNLDANLALSSGGGNVTLGGAVSGGNDLTVNLGGGTVTGLNQLQASVGDLAVNGTGAIGLTNVTTGGSQTYNTGAIALNGTLQGTGITLNNQVTLGGNSQINAGTGTLALNNGVAGGVHDLVLTGDKMDAGGTLTGTGGWTLQSGTSSRDIQLGGAPNAGAVLDLHDAFMDLLPDGLREMTIGRTDGSGNVTVLSDVAQGRPFTLRSPGGDVNVNADINLGDDSLTLNGRNITQTGSITARGGLDLTANGGAINLTHVNNSYGPVAIAGTPTAVDLRNGRDITQNGVWNLNGVNVNLHAGTHDILLNSAGNHFGTLTLHGRNATIASADDLHLGAGTLTGSLTANSAGTLANSGALSVGGNANLTAEGTIHAGAALDVGGNLHLNAGGLISQTAPITVDGNVTLTTTHGAGDVDLVNSGATTLGNVLVGGNLNLDSNANNVLQGAGTHLRVAGTFDPTGSGDVSLGGSGNVFGTYTPTGSDNVIRQSGVIELATINEAGNLVVVSEASTLSFDSAPIGGSAITLTDAGNRFGGSVTVTTSAPTLSDSGDVQTGIRQQPGTTLTVAGQASFTAGTSSVAGSGFIDLTNTGNSFGSLLVSGGDVQVRQDSGNLVIASASGSEQLVLTASNGGVTQTGAITTPALAVMANGAVTLNHIGNDVAKFGATTPGQHVALTSTGGLEIATLAGANGVDTHGGNLSLTSGGHVTQSDKLANIGTLTVDATGGVALSDATNSVVTVGGLSGNGDVTLVNGRSGLTIDGDIDTAGGDVTVVTAGDLTINDGRDISVTGTGDVVLSAAGNFINDNTGTTINMEDGRFLIYSTNQAGSDKGGLPTGGSMFSRTYGTHGPGTITQTGNQFIYAFTPTLTFRPNDVTVLYGQTPVLTYDVEGLLDGHTAAMAFSGDPSLSTAAVAGSNVGSYAIDIAAGSVLSELGYGLAFDDAGAEVTINPAPLTITVDDQSRTYGAANPALTYSASGFVLGQGVADLTGFGVSTSATNASNVGDYAITASGSSSNYAIDFVDGTLTVNPAALTITMNDQSRTYGAANPALSYGISGFVLGEDESVLTSFDRSTTATSSSNVGSYGITASAAAANYTISVVDGTLSVTPAPLTITVDDQSRTYGAANPALTYNASGFVLGQGVADLTGFGVNTSATNASNVGDYAITASGSSANYAIDFVDGVLTVNPAPLTITVNDQSRIYGAANPALTYNASGFVLGQGVADLTGFGVNTSATNASNVGDYAITASGSSANYAIDFVDGVLTVNPAPLTITVNDQSRTYGAANPALTYNASGFVLGQDVSALTGFGVGTGATQSSNVGDYAVTASGSSANYDIDFVDGTLTVNPAALTITLNDQSRTYGAANPALSYGISGFVLGEDESVLTSFDRSTTATPSSNVGSYGITASAAAANYAISVVDGTLSVTPAALTITVNDQSRTYGAANPALTYNASGFVLGQDVAALTGFGVSTGATQASNVGDYAITASGSSANYAIDFVDGTLTVNPAPLTITVNDQSRTYGAANPALTYNASGFVLGQGVAALTGFGVSTGATQASNVGDYAITASGSSANYAITFVDGNLRVNRAPLTITLHDQTRTYGAANPAFSYDATGFVLGQNASVLTGFGASTAATTASGVGEYAITGSGSSDNYDLNIVNSTLHITPAPVIISVADASRSYGSRDTSYFVSISGLVNGEDSSVFDGRLQITDTTSLASPVGVYEDVLLPNGVSAANYTISFAPADLTITPVEIGGMTVGDGSGGEVFAGQQEAIFEVAQRTEFAHANEPVVLHPFNSIVPVTTPNAGDYFYRSNQGVVGAESDDEDEDGLLAHGSSFTQVQ